MEDRSIVEALAQALGRFELIGMPARNLAARTRREYARDLRDVLSYLKQGGATRPAEVRLRDLEGYLADLDRRGLQGSTRNRKVHTLKTFFKWLVGQELLVTNPAAQLVAPRAVKKEPRYLSEEEYRRLLRACSHHARDAAIVEVFLQTGMRLSELAHLRLTDVELPKRITRDIESMGSVRVQRKGGKVERIPLNYKACQALAAYQKVRPTVEHDGLFVTKFKTRMTARSIEPMVLVRFEVIGYSASLRNVHLGRHCQSHEPIFLPGCSARKGRLLRRTKCCLTKSEMSLKGTYSCVRRVSSRWILN
ncbi:MAG TPA: tyrosine-type recombinase/integrase [Herpetosiphonaceae bacterium]|nr:tyrosine-type recombinase/integrase [Herpetosiphonaceae bacterium]